MVNHCDFTEATNCSCHDFDTSTVIPNTGLVPYPTHGKVSKCLPLT